MKTNYILFISLAAVLFFTACNKTATVNLEAGLVYKMGGAQPVARQGFYLLSKDLNEIFKEQGEIETITFGGFALKRYYDIKDLIYPVVHKKEYASLSNEVIPKYVKYKFQTDFQGKAQIKDVMPGTYYVFGNTETRDGRAVWNLQVDLKAGENSIVLDQNNAELSK